MPERTAEVEVKETDSRPARLRWQPGGGLHQHSQHSSERRMPEREWRGEEMMPPHMAVEYTRSRCTLRGSRAQTREVKRGQELPWRGCEAGLLKEGL